MDSLGVRGVEVRDVESQKQWSFSVTRSLTDPYPKAIGSTSDGSFLIAVIYVHTCSLDSLIELELA